MTFPFANQGPDVGGQPENWPLAKPIRLPALVGTRLVVGGPCRLMGWSLRESTGAATASIDFWDGNFNTGQLIALINLLAAESTRDWFPIYGIGVSQITMIVNGGSVDGVLYVVPL